MDNTKFDFDNDCVILDIGGGLQSRLKITGELRLQLFGEDGNLKHEQIEKNLVVNTGLQWLAKVLAGESTNAMTHVAVGSSATAVSGAQTALVSELGRVTADSRTRSGAQVTYVATFPAGTATGTLNEAGIFDGASGTSMFSRSIFTAGSVAKGASDQFVVTWVITFSAV